MGRWISRDPLGERGGSNTYKILNNDLLFHVDFLGLTEVDAAIARSQAKSLVEDARESNRKQLEKRRDEQNERARRVDETMKKNAERGDYKCCDDKKNAEGKQRLQNAHANAKARVNTEFKPDPSDPDSGPSCKNTHRWILEEMGSFPTCWTCALEERDGLAYRRRIQHLGIGDHCTIRCIAVDKSGKVKDQLFFDYAYNYADKYDEFKTDYPSIPENNGIPYHPGPTPLQCVNCNVRVSPRE